MLRRLPCTDGKNTILKRKYNLPNDIDQDLNLLKSTFEKSKKIYSSIGSPEQKMMEDIRISLEERLDKTMKIWAGYCNDSKYVQEHDIDASENSRKFEIKYAYLIDNNHILDKKLTDSGKRPKSNLDYTIWQPS